MDTEIGTPRVSLLRDLRLRAGLSQEELAERAGISARSISDIERGDQVRPFPATVRRLAEGLGLDPQEQARFTECLLARSLPTPERRGSATLDRTQRAGGLPHSLTTLIGREREIAAILGLLAADVPRLLVLTGPGGVGKTRLAVEVGWRLATTWRKVILVSLAPLGDHESVTGAMGEAIGITAGLGQDPVKALSTALGDSHALVIMDNFEHVVPAAAAVTRLLSMCPNLKVLCTSRSALNVYGEHRYVISPLPISDELYEKGLGDGAPGDAERLFVDRARMAGRDLYLRAGDHEIVAEICRKLDGLPLALELAAAWSGMMPLSELLAGLPDGERLLARSPIDAPPRHRSLQATINWTYGLLDPAERRLFRRLSVFRGGFTVEAAAAVAEPNRDRTKVLEGISQLVDKSLVERGDDNKTVRFSMLETIREGAHHWLNKAGEVDAVRRRHATHLASWFDDIEGEYSAPYTAEHTYHMVAAEQANSEAALRFAWEFRDIALGWQILSHAEDYRTEGSLTSWPSWVEQLRSTAEANPEALPRRIEVRVLLSRELMRVMRGEVAKSDTLDDGIETVLQCEEPRFQYGLLARVGHTLPLAPQLDETSRRFSLELAERYLAAARSVSKEGPQPGRFHYSVLQGEAEVAWQLHGDYARSRRLYEEALALARSTDDALDAAFTLHGLGFLNLVDRRLLEAADQLHEAAAKYEEVGILQHWAGAQQQLVTAYHLLGRLDEAKAVARGLLENPRVRPDVGLIRSLCRQVADLAVRSGMLSEAAIILGASNAYEREDEVWGFLTPGSVVTGVEEPRAYSPWFYAEEFERLQQTRRSLGAEVFEKLTHEGASMGVDAAADRVLGKRGGREHGRRDSAGARRNPKLEG